VRERCAMPVLELLIFGVGLSVGGKRAWRKLTGHPDTDDEDGEMGQDTERSLGPSPPGSPRFPHASGSVLGCVATPAITSRRSIDEDDEIQV